MVAAHAASSDSLAGVQTKILRRLGVSPGPVASIGPTTDTFAMPALAACTANKSSTPCESRFFTIATLSVCAPALTSITALRSVRANRCLRSPSTLISTSSSAPTAASPKPLPARPTRIS
jgi:hypothetical protein